MRPVRSIPRSVYRDAASIRRPAPRNRHRQSRRREQTDALRGDAARPDDSDVEDEPLQRLVPVAGRVAHCEIGHARHGIARRSHLKGADRRPAFSLLHHDHLRINPPSFPAAHQTAAERRIQRSVKCRAGSSRSSAVGRGVLSFGGGVGDAGSLGDEEVEEHDFAVAARGFVFHFQRPDIAHRGERVHHEIEGAAVVAALRYAVEGVAVVVEVFGAGDVVAAVGSVRRQIYSPHLALPQRDPARARRGRHIHEVQAVAVAGQARRAAARQSVRVVVAVLPADYRAGRQHRLLYFRPHRPLVHCCLPRTELAVPVFNRRGSEQPFALRRHFKAQALRPANHSAGEIHARQHTGIGVAGRLRLRIPHRRRELARNVARGIDGIRHPGSRPPSHIRDRVSRRRRMVSLQVEPGQRRAGRFRSDARQQEVPHLRRLNSRPPDRAPGVPLPEGMQSGKPQSRAYLL